MKNPGRTILPRLTMLAALATSGPAAAEILVRNQAEYFEAAKRARPGDTIVLANGVWNDFEIVLDAKGTAERPITLTAQEKGGVIVTGRSNLRLAGKHLVVRGLVFRHGSSPTREVIAFRRQKDNLAHHSRVTEVVIDRFNHPKRYETDFWVVMYGKHNRFDHNHLEGKTNAGVTLAVRLNSKSSTENHHRIDHNYFGPRPILGSNGGETLRIGTSRYSLEDSNTLVENNYFDRCNGELEIISNKSGGNVFRGNVFFESRGTLTLRHGDGNRVEKNVFWGNGADHTGGIRVINRRQTVRDNYLSRLTGHRFGAALVVMNGVPNSPLNRYQRVEDSLIENNTVIDGHRIELAAGSDEERTAVPRATKFRNNLIVNSAERDSIAVHDDIDGIAFESNLLDGVSTAPAETGFRSASIELERAENGLLYPRDRSLDGVGVSRNFPVLDREQTGVSWYPKAGRGSELDRRKTRVVQPGDHSLAATVERSDPGDVLWLEPGEHRVSTIVEIDRPITIAGRPNASKPRILFERGTLFELAAGGQLKLVGIEILGGEAPDASGNAVIRASGSSVSGNYRLIVNDVSVANLDTNHSFDFFRASPGTFAERVEIAGSEFRNITGHVLALDRETEDLGRYNGESIAISDSSFRDIAKTIASIYRGGTDESTFGPRFSFRRSKVSRVGLGRRNESEASIRIWGVQKAEIHANEFADSRPIRVVHTAGEPRTVLGDNLFVNTPEPTIVERAAASNGRPQAVRP
ncbi:MAG: polysaccharide lyase 6 family protein [Proteobacteria bacterium]|nr:polysaccharide lyase 6 family protein [Pseudomonadota bacterium]